MTFADRYRSRAGAGYVWAAAAVAITAIALVALDEWELWWLVPLAVLALSLALAGYVAPARSAARGSIPTGLATVTRIP